MGRGSSPFLVKGLNGKETKMLKVLLKMLDAVFTGKLGK